MWNLLGIPLNNTLKTTEYPLKIDDWKRFPILRNGPWNSGDDFWGWLRSLGKFHKQFNPLVDYPPGKEKTYPTKRENQPVGIIDSSWCQMVGDIVVFEMVIKHHIPKMTIEHDISPDIREVYLTSESGVHTSKGSFFQQRCATWVWIPRVSCKNWCAKKLITTVYTTKQTKQLNACKIWNICTQWCIYVDACLYIWSNIIADRVSNPKRRFELLLGSGSA